MNFDKCKWFEHTNWVAPINANWYLLSALKQADRPACQPMNIWRSSMCHGSSSATWSMHDCEFRCGCCCRSVKLMAESHSIISQKLIVFFFFVVFLHCDDTLSCITLDIMCMRLQASSYIAAHTLVYHLFWAIIFFNENCIVIHLHFATAEFARKTSIPNKREIVLIAMNVCVAEEIVRSFFFLLMIWFFKKSVLENKKELEASPIIMIHWSWIIKFPEQEPGFSNGLFISQRCATCNHYTLIIQIIHFAFHPMRPDWQFVALLWMFCAARTTRTQVESLMFRQLDFWLHTAVNACFVLCSIAHQIKNRCRPIRCPVFFLLVLSFF